MGAINTIRSWADDLLSILFPPLCEVCGSRLVHGELHICLHCTATMPRCKFDDYTFNTIHKRLMRHVPIERATAGFYYIRGNRFTNLIQSAKYRNRPRLARYLATLFANEMSADSFFDGIDLIIPVPMHIRKKRSRGYNQAEIIADAITDITAIPTRTLLIASRSHDTQTRKNALERWKNSRNIYTIDPSADLSGKHILIVDDVITTGSTLSACCETIHNHFPDTTISIFTLAATELG